MIRPRRCNSPSAVASQRGKRSPVLSPAVKLKPTDGCAIAKRLTISDVAMFSARSDFRNFNRAGVAENNSRTSTRVPVLRAAGLSARLSPRSTVISKASGAVAKRDCTQRCAIEPMEGSASPRKPSERISNKSSSESFDVAWRSTHRLRSAGDIPQPSSVTRISDNPPATVTTSISHAPASSAFSTSSLITLAGRSITSPAAMRLMVSSLSCRMATMQCSFWHPSNAL